MNETKTPLHETRQNCMKRTENGKRDFATFYHDWYPKVLHYLTIRCETIEKAEDIASQSFLYALEKYDSFDQKKASESTWIFMIAMCRWKNELRKTRNRENLDSSFIQIDNNCDDLVYQAVYVQEQRNQLARALACLPKDTRAIVILRWFNDLSPKEIALRMGMESGAVRTRLSRALDKLKTIIER